jgi:hypothetical protein
LIAGRTHNLGTPIYARADPRFSSEYLGIHVQGRTRSENLS